MTSRLGTMAQAVALVPDGATVVVGGAVLRRKPMALVRALAAAGRRDLHLVTFAGSLEVEVLLAAGALREVWSAYVGLGHHGMAPRFRAMARDVVGGGGSHDGDGSGGSGPTGGGSPDVGVRDGGSAGDGDGGVRAPEYSEWTLLQALRAGADGLPFLPTRAGRGSEVVADLGLRDVVDPYTGESWLAVPALRPDVAILHAWRATSTGDVQFSWPPEHLWDVDVLAARAADTVIVTVDQVVDRDVAVDADHLTRLFGFEVDLVVPTAAGAWPTASPPDHEAAEDVVAAYAASGDVTLLVPPGDRDAGRVGGPDGSGTATGAGGTDQVAPGGGS